MKVSIRSATMNDAKTMAVLAQDLGFKGTDEEFSSNLRAAISDPAVSVYVAESERSTVIGWAATEQRNFIQAGRSLEVTALVVAPSLRGRGVGRALMTAIESDALVAKLPAVRLRSSAVRVGTHEFYKAIGYEIQKTQHCFIKRLRG
jgi:N-acetylglutamate synthase-like GNAT family acetyltransferase